MFANLTSWSNLRLAYRKAAKGKRGHPNVAAFEYALEDNLLQLQNELQTQSYRPGGYVSFTIHEPKRRLISAAPFRDRVVHRALDRCQQFARTHRYVLQCDIRQFFPSLDHAVLRSILWQKVTDRQVRWLINQILASGASVLKDEYQMVWFPGDSLLAVHRLRGLPIGNLTSQFWANCYLNPFDHFIHRELRCAAYLRFVDDFLLFAHNPAQLWEWRAQIKERLSRFRLTIHPQAQPHAVSKGVSFLGFRVFAHKRRLKRRKGIHFQRKFKHLLQAYADGAISLDQLTASVQGWVNHTRYGNTIGLRKAVLTKQTIPPKHLPQHKTAA